MKIELLWTTGTLIWNSYESKMMIVIGNIEKETKKLCRSLFARKGIYFSKEPLFREMEFLERIEDKFILDSKGILHIGGHLGQESKRYHQNGKSVLFIEANPDIYRMLLENIKYAENQKAICVLLGDRDAENVPFYIASNGGASSSVLEFGSQLQYEGLKMLSEITLEMKRLDTVFQPADLAGYDHWVIDVQGSELMVLIGCGKLIDTCKSLNVEISNREVYSGGVKFVELDKFLCAKGFRAIWQPRDNVHQNLLYERISL